MNIDFLENLQTWILFVVGFIIIALSSKQIGEFFTRFKLPLITGFLFAGILVGPFGLGFISDEALGNLRFIDELSLAYIAFAAGSELFLKELRSRFRSITFVTTGLIVATFSLSSITVFFLTSYIPVIQEMPAIGRLAVALMAGAILVARSPSSAIAIVNELRAKGPFTQTVLGVTVIMDVGVIILFAINSEIADALLTGVGFNIGFVFLLLVELALSFTLGYLLGKWLEFVLSRHIHYYAKIILVLLSGYSVFLFSATVRSVSHEIAPVELLLEPLLICMVAAFGVTNFSAYRQDFAKILHDVGPSIYIIFFTLTGASLALDILAQIWPIALAVFVVRIVAIFLGSFTGGTLAGEPARNNRVSWMAYVTQAGVGLGLAKEVSVEFSPWGDELATVIIAVIVLNQIVGPPLFKWVINYVGEAHTRAQPAEFDGVRDALIFGVKPQSLQLARQLQAHDWQVKLICRRSDELDGLDTVNLDCQESPEITLETLINLDAKHADAIVSFMPVEDSFRLCELAYENYGTETMVVYLKNRAEAARFQELGVRVVEPQTAVVKLLEQFVRSPGGTPILLGTDSGQEMMDIEVADPDIDHVSIRDLSLPLDVLILSIHRDGQALVPHGYTALKLGDHITVVGPPQKLDEVSLKLEA